MNLSPTNSDGHSSFLEWRSTAVSIAIIVILSALAYSNSFSGPFVFDDIPTIVDSTSIRNLWAIDRVLFEGDTSALGRPLLNLSFALNYAFGGLAVAPFHMVNLMLHTIAGIVLMGVIRLTLKQQNQSAHLKEYADLISVFCTLIWLVHPLQTESVTYVTQRAESLVGLFYLLTLYCSIRAGSSKRSFFWPVAAVTSCLLGVASKEVIVSAPLAVVMYDLTFSGRGIRRLLVRRSRLYILLFSTWIPLFLLVSQGRQDSAGFGYGLSPWEYLLIQFGAITRYLHLSFWPDALVLDYGVGALQSPNEILPAAIVVILLAMGSIAAIKFQPWIAFLGFLFFAALSPSSSIIPIVTQTAAEHRMYLPLASITIITVVLIWQLCVSITNALGSANGSVKSGWVAPSCLLSLIVVCFAGLTLARNFEYADAIRLWKSNVQRWPESLRPYMLIGSEYLEKKHDATTAISWYDRAIESYQRVRQKNKLTKHVDLQLAGVYFGRGTAYTHIRNFEGALADFNRTLELNPKIVNAYFYKGMVLGQLGRDEEAIVSLTKALDLEVSPERLFIRGEILGRMQKYEEAIADLNVAIQRDPFNSRFYQSRGHCLIGIGRYQEALKDLTESLRRFPDYVKALNSRGIAYAAIQRHAEAIKDFSRAITVSPDFADAYLNRAKSRLSIGQLNEARDDLEVFEKRSGRVDLSVRNQLEEQSKAPATEVPPRPVKQ